MFSQSKNAFGATTFRSAHKLISEKYKKRKEFIKYYLERFPDWPLIRLRKTENTMRVLVIYFKNMYFLG